jgi:hypothetical protein
MKNNTVVAAQEHALDGEEVARDDAGRLSAQELAPTRTRVARGRPESSAGEQPTDCRWRDTKAELGHLTIDPAMAPAWILACPPQHESVHLGRHGRAALRPWCLISTTVPSNAAGGGDVPTGGHVEPGRPRASAAIEHLQLQGAAMPRRMIKPLCRAT